MSDKLTVNRCPTCGNDENCPDPWHEPPPPSVPWQCVGCEGTGRRGWETNDLVLCGTCKGTGLHPEYTALLPRTET